MDLNKAQRLLLKIQALLDSDNGNTLTRLEKDLMKSYILQLYEVVTTDEVASAPAAPVTEPQPKIIFEPPVIVPPQPEFPSQPKITFEPPVVVPPQPEPPPKIIYQPPVIEIPPQPEPPPPPKFEPQPPPSPQPPPISDSGEDEALTKLFATPISDDVSGRFSQAPIPSIESAMGLNERIFTLNELFGGDKGLFDETCAQLNGLSSYDEARRVLIAGVAGRFKWTDAERIKMAEQFLRIVARRYPRS